MVLLRKNRHSVIRQLPFTKVHVNFRKLLLSPSLNSMSNSKSVLYGGSRLQAKQMASNPERAKNPVLNWVCFR